MDTTEKSLAIVEAEEDALAVRPRSLSDLVAQFIQEQDISPASRATYTRSLRRLIQWLKASGLIGSPGSANGSTRRAVTGSLGFPRGSRPASTSSGPATD